MQGTSVSLPPAESATVSSLSAQSSTAVSNAESPSFGTPNDDETFRQNQVSTIVLHGVPIVSLYIDGKERLCLAQISNTLLKDYSYNEIHNRRVALGITCVQCTPVQLEVLRRAGAMPISSRRCGMITKREAERLVKSFLEEHTPPKLPDNFAFRVKHTCGWGCLGQFIPSRYNSSRAKCIKCTYCNLFFSPNKFIFHFHRIPDGSYRHPDAANFNSWRRHLLLDYENNSDDLMHAWEDVKAMFNGGSRKRVIGSTGKAIQDEEDVFTPKRQCFPHENDMSFNRKPMASSAYPFMSLPNVAPTNLMLPFPIPPPTHPMLPAPNDKINKDSPSSAVLEPWKHRPPLSPMCHPLGLLWAKSFGMYPFSNQNMKFYAGVERRNRETCTLPGLGTGSETDDRMSAFKPVNMMGLRTFGDHIQSSSVRETATASNCWGLPKLNNEMCNNNLVESSLNFLRPQYTSQPEGDKGGTSTNMCPDDLSSVTDSEVCIEDIAVPSPQNPSGENEALLKQENIKEEHSKRNDELDRPGMQNSHTGMAGERTHVSLTGHSEKTTVYEMSKEELQRELIRMMQHRDSP